MSSLDDHFPDPKWSEQFGSQQGKGGSHQTVKNDMFLFEAIVGSKFKIVDMGVSKNGGIPKSSILIGFSIINHPFWGTPIFGNTQIVDMFQVQPVNSSMSSNSW